MMKKSSFLFVSMFSFVVLTGCNWCCKKEETNTPASETATTAPITQESEKPEGEKAEAKETAISIKNIEAKEDFENAIKSDKIVVAKFYADWCPACKDMQAAFESVATTYAGKCEFVEVNIDKAKELAETQNIKGVPTIAIFKKGSELDRTTGKMSKEELEIKVKETIEEESNQ